MTVDRHLDWEGCFNARDLGGLPTTDGRRSRWGAIVRAENLDGLTAKGWAALRAHGIRTIVDLRNDEERDVGVDTSAQGTITMQVPLDDISDTEFWEYCWENDLDGSPLYYGPFLERKPERCATAIAAIAQAEPGGVVIHCGVGRDRTGLISLLLLALVGVAPQDIASDYELSNVRLRPRWAKQGEDDQGPLIEEILRRKNTSARALLLDILASLDVDAYLRMGGLSEDDLSAARSRLLAPPP